MLPEIAVWSDASRTAGCATLLQGVRDLVRVIAVGGPASQPVEELAQQHDLKPDDDLRRMLTNHPAGFLLLATTQTPDPSALQIALAHETRLLLLEPLAGDLTEWQSLTHRQRSRPGPPLMPIYIPAFLQCPGWLHTADPLETLGPMHSLMYTSLGRAGHGSLFMRLMDAWLSLITLTDFPDLIFAGLSGEQSTTPADLRQAHGHLQLHARLSGNRSLLMQVSDRASQPQRKLHILAKLAELEVTDLAYQLHDQQGKLLDEHPGTGSSPGKSDPDTLHTQSAASTSSLPVPTSPKPTMAGGPWSSPKLGEPSLSRPPPQS
ncbi:MAG: hypothetical protein HC898_09375, partial [Phycisphaerales bacterium]|nr:hypothetical protein [Phycisphaerales bacterium]